MASVTRRFLPSARLAASIALASLLSACYNDAVTVVTSFFSVGGNVSGLSGTVVLQLNGSGDLSISADGPFTFPDPLTDGAGYAVTVLTQPAGEICAVGNNVGTVAGANVTNVSVVCSATTFTVGGTVAGLVGTVVLQLNGSASVGVSANGPFTFPGAVPNGAAYAVTVLIQPAGEVCAVANGSGTVAGANVSNVEIVCSAINLTVGGKVSGLTGTVVLQLNGAGNLSISANGPFTFPATLPGGSGYVVTVLTQPASQNCSVANGSGTLVTANVTNVIVACNTTNFTVGGAVSGLAGTVVLRLNLGPDISISANGPFTFAGTLPDDSLYAVRVLTQPASQTCTVGNGHGRVDGANITNISVMCAAPPTFSVGGALTGLSLGGSVVLQNDEDTLTLTTNGSFVFNETEANGALYSVTVQTQPAGQRCVVVNGTGTIAGANVINVAVTCIPELLIFAADDGNSGVELWSSNGSDATLVMDINPGPRGSQPHGFTVLNGAVYFAATDGVNGFELWKTDGTTAGTALVKDINGGPGDSNPAGFTVFNGALYFSASDGVSGTELWKTDGTGPGTVRVKDINPGVGSSSPAGFTRFHGALFFSADDGDSGTELWKTDGTEAGTVLVSDIDPGTGDSNPTGFIVFNAELYFSADGGPSGVELWKSDGTNDGTLMVTDINPRGSSKPTGLTVLNGALYFNANDGVSGQELWKTDGTAAGTVLVKDIRQGKNGSNPTGLTVFNGALFFAATDGLSGVELWKSDGTGTGTVLVKDIEPGTGSSSPSGFTAANGALFFSADDGLLGTELWKTDGTDTGTVRVQDIKPGAPSSRPSGFAVLNGTLYFSADDGGGGTELWKSDGSSGGTARVKDIKVGAGDSNPAELTPF
jgi:ELWxxDGT repeat protein